MKKSDIEQIFRNAYKYNDTEVIDLLSKNQKFASGVGDFLNRVTGFSNMLSGVGLQRSQTPNGSQFVDSASFINFAKSGGEDNTYAIAGIIEFWRNTLKTYAVKEIPIPALKTKKELLKKADGTPELDTFGSPKFVEIEEEYTYKFNPNGYVAFDVLESIWNKLDPNSYNKKFGVDPGASSFTPALYKISDANTPSAFEIVSSQGSSVRFKNGTDKFDCRKEYIKIESNGVGGPGYIEALKAQLATKAPKESDDNHAKLMEKIGLGMSGASVGFSGKNGDRYFSSMLRQTSLGRDRLQGLASTWNYIVGLPDLIQKRQSKTPENVLEYKQKMILKSRGIELQKLLNKIYSYEVPIPNSGTPPKNEKKVVAFSKINKLPKEEFDLAMNSIPPGEFKLLGVLLADIQQEMDKDNSRVRKFMKDTQSGKNPFTPGGSGVKL